MIRFDRTNGTNHRNAKLTETQVHLIRFAFDNQLDLEQVAQNFGVSLETVRRIGKRISWQSLKQIGAVENAVS